MHGKGINQPVIAAGKGSKTTSIKKCMAERKQSAFSVRYQQKEEMMKKNMKLMTMLCMVLFLVGSFTGCGSENGSGEGSQKTGSSDGTSIKIEDLDWTVDEGIVDGERYVLLSVTNNSEYTVAGLNITFQEKAGITDDERKGYYESFMAAAKAITDDETELKEIEEKIKEREISLYAETDCVADPGESVRNIHCFYYMGYFYVTDIAHYELVVPDIATIRYVDGNEIKTVYYDFSSRKYTEESETEIAYEWTQTELGNKIPKPDVKVLENFLDDSDDFSFEAYGITLEKFNAYVNECRAYGFTVNERSHDGYFMADDSEGYQVDLFYNEDDDSMHGSIESPELDSGDNSEGDGGE